MILSMLELKGLEQNFLTRPEGRTTEDDRTYIYSMAYHDRYFFIEHFLQPYTYIIEEEKKVSPWYFEELRAYLDDGGDVDLIVPRWHSKTTGILIWILHSICYGTTKGILYIANGLLGQKGIGRIRWEMETNPMILAFFWQLVPRNSEDIKDRTLKKRHSTFLEFTNGCWLQTLSMGQTVRWWRPNKILCDDVQENKDVMNKKTVDKLNSWIFTSLYNTLMPWGSMAVVWTIVWELCLVKYLRDDKKRRTIEYEACDDNFENILRPEMWTKEALELRKKSIGTANFNQEYRNIPLQFTNAVIKPEWFRYYTLDWKGWVKLPDKFDKLVLAIDPAQTTTSSSDFTGWCLTGHLGNDRYVIKAWQVKLSPLQNEEWIYAQYLRYNPTYVLKEDNVEAWITEHLKKRGVRIESIRASKDKYTRLMDIAYLVEFGNVFFSADIDDELLYQLTHYPDCQHDDILDAMVYSLLGWKPRNVCLTSL